MIVANARSASSGGFKRPRPLGLVRTASSATIASSNNGDQGGSGGISSSGALLSAGTEQQQQTGVAPIPPPSLPLTAGPWLTQRAVPALLEVCGFARVHSKPLSLTPFPLIHLLSALTAAHAPPPPAPAAAPLAIEGDATAAMDVVAADTSSGGSSSSSTSNLAREFTEVPGPLPPPPSGGGGRKGGSSSSKGLSPAEVGPLPPFFLARCCLSLLRLALARHARTGEQLEGEEFEDGLPTPPVPVRIRGFATDHNFVREVEVYHWALVRYNWGQLLNPLTLPELLRRYLRWRARERRLALRGKETVAVFCDEGSGFCPFGEGFEGTDALVAEGLEALDGGVEGLGALPPEGMLAVLRVLCEDVQGLRAVQDFVAIKVEVRSVGGCYGMVG